MQLAIFLTLYGRSTQELVGIANDNCAHSEQNHRRLFYHKWDNSESEQAKRPIQD